MRIRRNAEPRAFFLYRHAYNVFAGIGHVFDRVFPYRFILVGLYALGVVLKNRQIAKELRALGAGTGGEVALSLKFDHWYHRARYSAAFAGIGGVIFFVMFDERVNQRWLPIIVEGEPVRLSHVYYDWAPLIFYIFFALFAIKLFREDAAYLADDQFVVDLEEAKLAHRRPADPSMTM